MNRVADGLRSCLAAGLMLMMGCGAESSAGGPREDAQLPSDGIGTILARVETNDRGVVTFYQTESKRLLIRESRMADAPGAQGARGGIDALLKGGASFSEVYRDLSGQPAPRVLTDAETANKEALAQEARNDPGTGVADTLGSPLAVELHQDAEVGDPRLKGEPEGCAPDYYNDNYGAQWFIENFVNEGNFRNYFTNVERRTYRPGRKTSWYKASAMAADFKTPVRFYGGYMHNSCECINMRTYVDCSCSYRPHLEWDMMVQPRWIETMYCGSGNEWVASVEGQDPCRKAHLGVMFNN